VPGGVGDDAEAGHFRSGARSGVDRQIRGHRLGGFVDAFVVVDLAAVGNHQANALAAVMGGTAAQGDEGVAFLFFVDFDAGVDVLVGGVGDCFIIDHIFHLGGIEQVGDLLGDARAGDALIGDDQRFGAAQRLDFVRDLLGSTNADEGNAGNEITVYLFTNCHNDTILF